MADDLSAPLGLKPRKTGWRAFPFGVIGIVVLILSAGAVATWIALFPDPTGGEPSAAVRIDRGKAGISAKDIAVADGHGGEPQGAGPGQAEPGGGESATQIAEVQRLGIPAEGEPLSSVPIAKVTEQGKFGPLPKIAQDGSRPLEVYSRPVPRRPSATPKVVIVVGGIGLSQSGTQEAIRLLPPEVTLAFAPYGSNIDRWVQRVRQQGHEVLVQLPMEPFDFPDNDPGPHTLLTTLAPEQNLERMHAVLGRVTNYVGVINHMGARFTADEGKLTPMFRDLAARGLMFLDDGSSTRSLAEPVARGAKLPFVRADLVVDSTTTESAIDAKLQQLESIARSQGLAIGVASALPISIRKIGEWAKTLESRGVVIVPVSAAARERPSG